MSQTRLMISFAGNHAVTILVIYMYRLLGNPLIIIIQQFLETLRVRVWYCTTFPLF